MLFRLSKKLAKKLKVRATDTLPFDDNPYADWSAHLFTAARTQFVIVTNTKSLYSTVMHGKGVTNGTVFVDRSLSAIREFMEGNGLGLAYSRFIAPPCGSVRFGKALNRSVTGSMNELIGCAKMWLAAGGLSMHEISFRLNDTLLSAIADPGDYGKPREVFISLADDRGWSIGDES